MKENGAPTFSKIENSIYTTAMQVIGTAVVEAEVVLYCCIQLSLFMKMTLISFSLTIGLPVKRNINLSLWLLL